MFFTATTRTQYLLAGNRSASGTLLTDLSRSSEARVRARVAEHPNTPMYTLLKLSQDDNAEVRHSVIFNPHTPRELLFKLAADSNADVRYAIAEELQTQPGILKILSKDPNPYVADRASKTLLKLQETDRAPQAA